MALREAFASVNFGRVEVTRSFTSIRFSSLRGYIE